MKGLLLCEHQERWRPTEAPRSIRISNMVLVLQGSAAVGSAVAGIRRSEVASRTSTLFNRPIWSRLYFLLYIFLLPQQWRIKSHFWRLQRRFWRSNAPQPAPPSSLLSGCGSKDSGYADCQLGVPTSAIRTRRKTDVSKGNPEESAALWRGHKMFYADGLQRGDSAAFAESLWRANCYFKGS